MELGVGEKDCCFVTQTGSEFLGSKRFGVAGIQVQVTAQNLESVKGKPDRHPLCTPRCKE